MLNLEEKYRRDTYPIQMLVIALLEEHPRNAYTDNYCYPIQRFLRLYHLQHDGGFQTVHTVTKTLASIQWVLRAVLYDNMDTTFKSKKVGWSHAKKSKFVANRRALISGDLNVFTCFTTVLDMKHLANYHVHVAPNLPKCSWYDEEGTILTVNGKMLSLTGIRNMVASMTTQVQQMLDDLSFGMDWSIPDQLTDILPNDHTGFSFVAHNKLDGLAVDILRTAVKLSHIHDGIQDGKILWKLSVAQKYLAASRDLLKVPAPLIHITRGSPARGEELCTAKLVNTPNALRNAFLVGGRIYLILQFHKGSN